MTEKPQTEKERAHMLYKRAKGGMRLSGEELKLVTKYYGHIDFKLKVRKNG